MKKFFTLISLSLIFLTSCGPSGAVEPTSTPLPASTSTPIPTPTITPTLEPTPVASGIQDPGSIPEFYYSIYKIGKTFPFFGKGYTNSDGKKVLDSMYKSINWDDSGRFEIITPKGDKIVFGESTINNGLMTFKMIKNTNEIATIASSPGVIFQLMTDVIEGNERKDLIFWGLYSPEDNSLVDFVPNFNKKINKSLYSSIYLLVDEDWMPYFDNTWLSPCNNEVIEISKQIVEDQKPSSDEERERLISVLFTYQLPNGNIYKYGPEPFVCPYFEILYPTN